MQTHQSSPIATTPAFVWRRHLPVDLSNPVTQSVLAGLTALRRLAVRVSAGMERRRTYGDLLLRSDAMLRDIGVTRAEILAASRRPIF